MRAIDTNIIVRFLTGDDKQQAKAARSAIAAGNIFIATTVLLESEWVLRSGYAFTPEQISAGLRRLAGLPGVAVEAPVVLAHALDWLNDGMDFADALHLATSNECDVFLSFDRKFARMAKGRTSIRVEAP